MSNEDWINTFINKFNESKDYKIIDVSDREKLLCSGDGYQWYNKLRKSGKVKL